MSVRLYLGSDHAGFSHKEALKVHLKTKGYSFVDLGTFSEDPVDYPDIAHEVCEKVRDYEGANGILLCGTGIGVSIAANKEKGIRAALCMNEDMAKFSKQHNDANVLAMGARMIAVSLMYKIVDAFLEASFSGEERHVRRVKKLE